ncbi:MAG: aromatic acid exporter family protein [Clostridia bacterium]|nr:aromatic acid exporter family protein [Clostridia bacterium]
MRLYRSFKLALGFIISVNIAIWLNLDFPISAGVITMLNMLDTKKASAKVAWKRLYASAFGLILALVIFRTFGFHHWVLILLVVIFIPIAFKLNAREGMAVHVVLSSHLMTYHVISWAHIFNEYTLVVIGALVALVVNSHMPNKVPMLQELIQSLEEQMRLYILNQAYLIRNMCFIDHEVHSLEHIKDTLRKGFDVAVEHMNNNYLKKDDFYLAYFEMRRVQINRLAYMEEHIHNIILNLNEARMISVLTEELALLFDMNNGGQELLKAVKRLKKDLSQMDLPKDEFEMMQKAFLIQYVMDLEAIIQVKVNFSEKYL